MPVSPSRCAIWSISLASWYDRWSVPLNKVIMKIETPSMSENGRTYFNTEEEKNKTQNYFEKTSV